MASRLTASSWIGTAPLPTKTLSIYLALKSSEAVIQKLGEV
jgi:hypothetical protein